MKQADTNLSKKLTTIVTAIYQTEDDIRLESLPVSKARLLLAQYNLDLAKFRLQVMSDATNPSFEHDILDAISLCKTCNVLHLRILSYLEIVKFQLDDYASFREARRTFAERVIERDIQLHKLKIAQQQSARQSVGLFTDDLGYEDALLVKILLAVCVADDKVKRRELQVIRRYFIEITHAKPPLKLIRQSLATYKDDIKPLYTDIAKDGMELSQEIRSMLVKAALDVAYADRRYDKTEANVLTTLQRLLHTTLDETDDL